MLKLMKTKHFQTINTKLKRKTNERKQNESELKTTSQTGEKTAKKN